MIKDNCDSFYLSPPDYDSLVKKLKSLKKTFPFIQMFTVCKSVLGRKIHAIGVGNLHNANLFVGATHASEWITTSVLMQFFENLCHKIADEKESHLLQSDYASSEIEQKFLQNTLLTKGLIIIPMLNPDGVEIALNGVESARHRKKFVQKIKEKYPQILWQANANGIDLNHNFDAGFALCKKLEFDENITEPSPRQFGGITPHSEPESSGLVNLCTSFNIKTAFAFHSQGEEIYFEYGKNTPSQSLHIAHVLSSYSGYTLSKPNTIASHAGFKDWFIDKLHKPAFTVEIGLGENPLPIANLPSIYKKLEEMLFVASFI